MNNRSICSPAVAGDMLLMALFKLGLDELLKICFFIPVDGDMSVGP